ncbi:MAG: RluA family pseudouridine synthase [Bacteroides sp.]|nr:RluA family pseudouridine synthase [Prevotella sp.]MCM1407265.1 RluA family pseudouridine synthase [Treponema brennaborense]MCM1469753.1 RluA family pseudouridine synthase [Bacteroides sp.]
MPFLHFVVGHLDTPIRLDKYVGSAGDSLCAVSRSRLKAGIVQVKVNGSKAKLSSKIAAGDTVDLEWTDSVTADLEPQEIPLDILYDDRNVTVINKKQGMVVHPAAGNWNGTLVNALLWYWGNPARRDFSSDTCSLRPGIVHRLDKDTSGCIIAARNSEAETWLQNQFRERRVRKEYIAVVKGRLPAARGSIKTQIIRDPSNRKRFVASADTARGKFAHTLYSCVAVYGMYTLVRLRLKTGRTHQIRVHLKYLNCPILGDPLYSRPDKNFPGATLMLHSRKLSIRLPGSDVFCDFVAPVPLRFKKVMQKLHREYGCHSGTET